MKGKKDGKYIIFQFFPFPLCQGNTLSPPNCFTKLVDFLTACKKLWRLRFLAGTLDSKNQDLYYWYWGSLPSETSQEFCFFCKQRPIVATSKYINAIIPLNIMPRCNIIYKSQNNSIHAHHWIRVYSRCDEEVFLL